MSGDLREAIQILAADNARMCTRLIAAEELAAALRDYLSSKYIRDTAWKKVAACLDAYDATRPV